MLHTWLYACVGLIHRADSRAIYIASGCTLLPFPKFMSRLTFSGTTHVRQPYVSSFLIADSRASKYSVIFDPTKSGSKSRG